MSLQQALDDCLIDFDRRVLVTDLLEEYKLTYKEAHDALEAHIKEQERASANKYEKRFLVHGLQKAGDGDVNETLELFKIVQGEDKLKEWLAKLQNSQSQLYSVEIAGGSKSAAPIFEPMQQVQVKLAKLEHRAGAATAKPTSNGTTLQQAAPKPTSTKVEPRAETAEEPPKKTSPSEQGKGKGKGKAVATKKGGINSFFSAAPATAAAKTQQQQQPKEAKPAASSSMQNFFKKQPAAQKSPPTESVKKELSAASNISVQLFDVESESSSDEEEKLDKLRRTVVGDGDESDEVGDSVKKPNSKRRRISDSEDEEQPQKKSAETPQHIKQKDAEKKKEEEEDDDEAMDVAEAETSTNETFLDDDGFVITVRPKKPMQQKQPAKKKTSPKAAAATATSASSTKKKSPTAAASKSSVKETPKTKQGNIMSFFSKKWMYPSSPQECCGCCFGFSLLELMLLISRN